MEYLVFVYSGGLRIFEPLTSQAAAKQQHNKLHSREAGT